MCGAMEALAYLASNKITYKGRAIKIKILQALKLLVHHTSSLLRYLFSLTVSLQASLPFLASYSSPPVQAFHGIMGLYPSRLFKMFPVGVGASGASSKLQHQRLRCVGDSRPASPRRAAIATARFRTWWWDPRKEAREMPSLGNMPCQPSKSHHTVLRRHKSVKTGLPPAGFERLLNYYGPLYWSPAVHLTPTHSWSARPTTYRTIPKHTSLLIDAALLMAQGLSLPPHAFPGGLDLSLLMHSDRSSCGF